MKNVYITTQFLRSTNSSSVHLVLSRFSADNLNTFAVIGEGDDREWLKETGWLEHFHGTATTIPDGSDAVLIGSEVDFLWCHFHPSSRMARPTLMDALSSRWQFPTQQPSSETT